MRVLIGKECTVILIDLVISLALIKLMESAIRKRYTNKFCKLEKNMKRNAAKRMYSIREMDHVILRIFCISINNFFHLILYQRNYRNDCSE